MKNCFYRRDAQTSGMSHHHGQEYMQKTRAKYHYLPSCGPGSSVGIASDYGPDGPRNESRWGGEIFCPFQIGPGAHAASCTMGTGSFPGVKCGRAVLLTTHPFQYRGLGRVELYLYPPLGLNRACKEVTLPFIYGAIYIKTLDTTILTVTTATASCLSNAVLVVCTFCYPCVKTREVCVKYLYIHI